MGYLLILRPINCALTAASVMVGAWIGLPKHIDVRLLFAMIIGFLACGYGNIINDVFDINIDAVNAPQRPLPGGLVKKNWVIIEAIGCALISLVLAVFIDLKAFVLVILALFLLLLYSSFLKKYWPANIAVAILTGFSFLLGGIVNSNTAALFPFVFAVLIHIPREIIKDLIDEAGDRQVGIITCAVRVGSKKARILATASLGLFGLLMPLPFIFRILDWKYMIAVLLVAFPLLIYLVIRLLRHTAIPDLRISSRILKIIMIIGLAAMII